MRLACSLTLITICLFLTSCAPKALIPDDFRWKPKLYGNVKNGVYTTSVGRVPGRGRFSILIPQNRNRYEYIFLKPKEFYGHNYTSIVFGPTASDRNIYRTFVGLKYCSSLRTFRAIKFPMWAELVEKGYYRQMDKIYQEDIYVHGRPAIFEVYLQHVQGYYNYIGMYQPDEVTFTHAIYTIDYGHYGVILWIQASSGSGLDLVNDQNRYLMIDRLWEPQIRFVRNFVLYPQCRGVDCKHGPLFCASYDI